MSWTLSLCRPAPYYNLLVLLLLLFFVFHQGRGELPVPVPKKIRPLPRSSYTSLSNPLVLPNCLSEPTIWHPIQIRNTTLFVFCSTILDIKNFQLLAYVESISSCVVEIAQIARISSPMAVSYSEISSPEPKLQNHTIMPQPIPYKILVESFSLFSSTTLDELCLMLTETWPTCGRHRNPLHKRCLLYTSRCV